MTYKHKIHNNIIIIKIKYKQYNDIEGQRDEQNEHDAKDYE